MRKIYIYLTIIILIFLSLYSIGSYIKVPSSKYDILTVKSDNALVKTIVSYITMPIIEVRIDFYLKNTGIISYLQQNKYDNKTLNIEDIKEGEGQTVLCGQEVVVDITETFEGGVSKDTDNQTIKIGTNEVQAFNIALLGMKKGGERSFVIQRDASARLLGKDDIAVMYRVKLKEVENHHPKSVKNLLIFDEVKGNEKAVMCGENVTLHYVARNKKREEIKRGDLTFKVGAGQVPLAFELGIIDMVPGSKRTVISPPNLLAGISFPKDEITILDFTIT